MSEIINLVCSHGYNNLLHKLDGYIMDLGMAYSKKDELRNILVQDIKDSFVKDFIRDYNEVVHKVGVFGNISIYVSLNIKEEQVIISNNTKTRSFDIDLNSARFNTEKSLAQIIMGLMDEDEDEDVDE